MSSDKDNSSSVALTTVLPAGNSSSFEDAEYPGIAWVRAYYILHQLKDGERMPRCQDLPPSAFGSLRKATRVFAVTHPWLGRWQPDPNGIQVETLRAKLSLMHKELRLDKTDVVFFDYLSLPQVCPKTGRDDRTADEKERFRQALSGDLMGRIFLTSVVLIIDEVPKEAESNVPYLGRGWCYFECRGDGVLGRGGATCTSVYDSTSWCSTSSTRGQRYSSMEQLHNSTTPEYHEEQQLPPPETTDPNMMLTQTVLASCWDQLSQCRSNTVTPLRYGGCDERALSRPDVGFSRDRG